jgi:adenine-specific DNA-methyltransferase
MLITISDYLTYFAGEYIEMLVKKESSQLKLDLNNASDTTENIKDFIPHIIKYMGSKKPIIDFVVNAINEIHRPNMWVCDLFSGSCSISAALRKKYNFISNDIQDYSRILANTYFSDLSKYEFDEINEQIEVCVKSHFIWFKENYPDYFFDYSKISTLEEFAKVESKQRELFFKEKFAIEYHLFVKYYSGTYWSFEQCVWIDALRKAAESFKGSQVYYAFVSSIMYAMSYTTQSTGHFAQYRDGDTQDAMANILYYRQKNLYNLFIKKLKALLETLDDSLKYLQTTTLDFEECLKLAPEGSTVYADPPYAPVHYSRFYHALETLVKYDYPPIDHKGRYRSDRHQSPFSQKSNALRAFEALFDGIINKKAQMILSYSSTGVIEIEKIIDLARKKFEENHYSLTTKTLDHKHSTMGRFEDAERDVVEYLIITKKY